MFFKKKKGAIELSFGWLFAIIAGIAIIVGALYLGSKIVGTQQQTISAQTGTQIGILLDPLETSFESAQTTSITVPIDSRIDNGCETTGNFGEQVIQVEQKNFNKWTQTNIDVRFENKYIFSENQTEGKKFYIFSKPFYFPFKVADLIYITSSNKRYCFVGAPSDVYEEINNLNQENLITQVENCSANDVRVCFGGSKCDINVNYNEGYVEKNNERVYFAGVGSDQKTLMYSAIFADKVVYECQLKRLMMRIGEISLLYRDKELLTRNVGCDDNLGGDLQILNNFATLLNSSSELGTIKTQVDVIDGKNNGRRCLLW